MANTENPALVVEHGSKELRQNTGGGGERKRFAEPTAAFRQQLAQDWQTAARAALEAAGRAQFRAGVVKVKLRTQAIAKSHRPRYLFQQAGRGKIIGAGAIGTLLVSVMDESVAATANTILENTTQDGEADLTTIESVSAYTPDDVAQTSLQDVDAYRHGAVVTLFDFKDEAITGEAVHAVARLIAGAGATEAGDRRDRRRFLVRECSAQRLREIALHPAVRKIWPNASVSAPVTLAATIGATVLDPPRDDHAYPIVGVLDTAVSPAAAALHPWVTAGPSFVAHAADPDDCFHATFIAGLIAGGRQLNPGVTLMPVEPCRVLAARVFSPREDLGIEDLLARVDESVRRHPEVKVWNVSLGVDTPCLGPEFSPFAWELDEIARRYQVLFVVAAGNYRHPPLRPWPPDAWHQDDRDLIGPPADAILGLSVGSVAHAHAQDSAVQALEPAAYSRRGPAPGLVPKPEVTHFGGNCSLHNTEDGCGVASFAPDGSLVQSWGTSYAAPLVAALAAHGWNRLIDAGYQPAPDMVRALVIHAAALNSPSRRSTDLHYFGFGVPGSLDEAFACDPSAFTTWHRVFIPKGQHVEHEFPMPECLLADGKFRGEITITLCYAPVLDRDGGAEYCRSNVNVGMGIFKPRKTSRRDRDTGEKKELVQDGFRSEVPPDPGSPGEAYEQALIESGFKWSPVKVYRRRFPRGIEGVRWQLRFEVLYRDDREAPEYPHAAFAIVTVRGLDESQPVYRDGVRALQQKGHVAQSAMSARVQVRL